MGNCSFWKITTIIFNPKTNMQDEVLKWPCSGSLLPVPFKHRWKNLLVFATPSLLLSCWSGPLQYEAHFFTGSTHKNTIHQPWQQHITHTHTHVHVYNQEKYLHRLNMIIQESCAKPRRRWLILPMFYGKLYFSLAHSILHECHLETKRFVLFSQQLWSEADHHISHYHHIPYYNSSSGVTNLTIFSLFRSVQRMAK